jgi:ADP-ribosylglycohydrolase
MVSLRDKFHGCIAGSWIGSAMGAVVEGWPYERVEQTHGVVDKLMPYKHYIEYTDWPRPAGTTEDGIERQRLIATAIIEKQDRIHAQDLAEVWVRDLDPDKMVYKQEPFDRSLLLLVKAGVPASELGRLCLFPNIISMARVSHPIGLINAGDPQSAADDSFDVGRLYAREITPTLRWAALYNAGIAEACKPDATVESVISTIVKFSSYRLETGSLYKGAIGKFAYETTERDVNRAFELAAKYPDPKQLRAKFYETFTGGCYVPYGMSTGTEIVSKGLAIFALHQGDPKAAIITAANFGRDTDCLCAIAGGLCGTLKGVSALPTEWITQVDEATKVDPYTNSRRTVTETADGLYGAFQTRHRRLRDYLGMMKEAT